MIVIIAGSKRDSETYKEIARNLEKFPVPFKVHIASAHKTPEYLLKILDSYEKKQKPLIYICVAGRSNALGGFVDAQTVYPVINCPPKSAAFAGLDILSSLRMPSGIAALTVLEADQASLAAVKMLALQNKRLKNKIVTFQNQMKKEVLKINQ